ncbi:hypothetical protein EFA46_004815 [Halarchaeum sp. CBA1220]|uniref:hypothetical protein n=1 Tax=Halarchaeum sp. CBA1220 TaxID=1853682 RepID=UPI000F3A96B3|nr:hypothetical protein [Halarchaeum sp. CBA1220]QLC33549.1 hypothetical protein EFA46_004815 [Halarchaeum sp. CBA1220]
MADVRMRLLKQDRGPITVEVDDEWEHELELEGVAEEPDGLHGEAGDAEADDVRYRFVTDDDEELPVYLERRHARDEAFERVGEVTDVAIETNVG